MFKLLTIGVLIYLFYRLVMSSGSLPEGKDSIKIKEKGKNKASEEDDYIDYEEVD